MPRRERTRGVHAHNRCGSRAVLSASQHICAFFHSHEEEYRVLLPFIQEGFARGEKAFHIVDPARRDAHLQRLAAAGIDTAAAQQRGQFELRTWTEAICVMAASTRTGCVR